MNVEDKRLEKVWRLLSIYPTDFLLAYSEVGKRNGGEIKLKMAWSRQEKTEQDYQKIAQRYRKFAMLCYQRRLNFILEKTKHSRFISEHCLEMQLEKNPILSKDAIGQCAWYLFIAAGSVRKAGYVIVAKINAKNEKDVHKLIREIQITFQGAVLFLRLKTMFHLLLHIGKNRKKRRHL